MSSRPGQGPPSIDGYRIEALLGRGATGTVFSAIQLAVDRPVALKVLHPELVGSQRAIHRLQREARTAARLAHPAIITAIDMGEADGRWWYAMELVEGISLAERLTERGPMAEREALRFFIPLCDGLEHASEGGVVHRDIKPSNILIDSLGHGRLVDLGLAFSEDDPKITKPGGTLGTPHYISPEQARDPCDADIQSDIWSFGATMYHALCGRPPFQGDSVAEILSGVLYHRVPDPRLFALELSKGFTLVLRKCLTRDPQHRYHTPAQLLRDLERIRERRAPQVRTANLDPLDDGRPAWLRPALAAAAGVVLIGAILAFWRPWEGGSSAPPSNPTPVRTPWAALDGLAQRYQGGDLSIAAALDELAALAPVPEGGEAQRSRVAMELRADLQGVIQDLRDGWGVEVVRALGARDLPRADQLLGVELAQELLQASGFESLQALPGGVRFADWTNKRREELGRLRQASTEEAGIRLGHLTESIQPAYTADLDANRWRDALDRVRWSEDWFSAAGVDGARMLGEDRRQIRQNVDGQLESLRNAVFRGFSQCEQDLVRFLEGEFDSLVQRMRAGEVNAGAEALAQRLTAERERRGIRPEQVPEGYAELLKTTADGRLAQLTRELERIEIGERELAAWRDFELDQEQADAFCRERRYERAAALWKERLGEQWRAAVHGPMELRRREALLLQEWLEGVADALRSMRGRSTTLTFEGMSYKVRIVKATNPIEGGIDVDPSHVDGFHVDLVGAPESKRRLGAGDLLNLAPVDGGDPGQGLLTRALFLFHEGKVEAAHDLLSGTGTQLADDPLYVDLRARVDSRSGRVDQDQERRRGEKDRRLGSIRFGRQQGGDSPARLLAAVEVLFEQHGDLLTPREDAEMRSLRDALRAEVAPRTPEEALREAYAPDRVERRLLRDLSLAWTFEDGEGAWDLGAWRCFGGGVAGVYLSRAPATDDELLSAAHALRLALVPPLDVDRDLKLDLRLRWAEEHDDLESELLVSIAGMHVLFLDRLAGGENRWGADRGDPAALLAALRGGAHPSGDTYEGLPRARALDLRVEVNAKTGQLDVRVDGVHLGSHWLRKGSSPQAPEIALRSSVRMELLEVGLHGQREAR